MQWSSLTSLLFITRERGLARIYSLAVAHQHRGTGIAKQLILAGEQAADMMMAGSTYGWKSASITSAAIKLYQSLGYQKFGIYRDYYQDHIGCVAIPEAHSLL